jgi:hypothetical protein
LHSGRRPLAVIAVGLGLVLFARDVRALRAEATRMRRDALAAVKDLDGGARRADVHRGTDELARCTVIEGLEPPRTGLVSIVIPYGRQRPLWVGLDVHTRPACFWRLFAGHIIAYALLR